MGLPSRFYDAIEKLKNNTTKSLDLRGNKIGDEGMRLLCDALKQNKTLQSLDLEFNQFGPESIRLLCDALKQNSTLEFLNLKGNRIGDEGVQLLCNALKQNKTLQSVNLEWNCIGSKSILWLCDALKQNNTLQLLNLKRNIIGDEGRQYSEDLKRLFDMNHKSLATKRLNLYAFGKIDLPTEDDPALLSVIETWEMTTESDQSALSPKHLPKELSVEIFKQYIELS